MGVGQNAQKVSHGTAGHKEGVLLAHDPGGHLLQADEGGILAVDVVAHLCAGHRLAHLVGGKGEGVAAEIEFHAGVPPYILMGFVSILLRLPVRRNAQSDSLGMLNDR